MATATELDRTGLLGRFQIRHLYPLIAVAVYPLAAARPIGDNSFLWHVRAGAAQWELGQVLSSDVFSYTMAGTAWRTQSWLAELLYYGLEDATGTVAWAGLMVTIVGIAALGLIGISLYGATESTMTTAIWLFFAVWLAAPFATPRPVIFSYLLLAALVLMLRLNDRLLWGVVPLMWIWGTLHGSWPIALALLILEAIRRRSWKMASLAGLSVVAVSFTAHGLGAWHIVWQFLSNRGALEFLQEWGPPEFGDVVQAPYALVIAGVVIAAARGRIRANDLWIVVPFLLMGLTTQRTVFPAAIVLMPYAALAFDIRLPAGRRQRSLIPWALAAIVFVVGIGVLIRPMDLFEEETFPNDELLATLETNRFFHDDAVGGYLIYRDWPEVLVHIDDRAELYGAEFFAEHRATRMGTYEELFDRYGITEAIVKPRWPLEDVLVRDGWIIAYEDEFFILMRAPGGS